MEWDAAFEEAGVEGSSPARQSAYRTIRVAKDGAKAEAARATPLWRGCCSS